MSNAEPINLAESSERHLGSTRPPLPPALLITLLSLTLFGMQMAMAGPQYISLAVRLSVLEPESGIAQLSVMLTVSVVVQALLLGVIGQLSDATRSRMGMRRPWLIASAVGVAIGSVVLWTAPNVPLLWVGMMTVTVFATITYGLAYAIVPDQIKPEQHGVASGALGASMILGILAVLFVVQLAPDNNFMIFGVPGICALVPLIALIVLLRDRRLLQPVRLTGRDILAAFYVNPKKSPSLAWFLPAMLLVMSVSAAVLSYTYYILGQFVADPNQLAQLTFVSALLFNGAGVVFSLAVGRVSDKIGRRKPFFSIAVVLLVAGALVIAYSNSLEGALIGALIVGAGHGTIAGIFLALGTETMTDEKSVGHDVGVVMMCFNLSFAVIPLLAPLLLGADGSNFTLLLAVAAAITALSLAFIVKVKVR